MLLRSPASEESETEGIICETLGVNSSGLGDAEVPNDTKELGKELGRVGPTEGNTMLAGPLHRFP